MDCQLHMGKQREDRSLNETNKQRVRGTNSEQSSTAKSTTSSEAEQHIEIDHRTDKQTCSGGVGGESDPDLEGWAGGDQGTKFLKPAPSKGGGGRLSATSRTEQHSTAKPTIGSNQSNRAAQRNRQYGETSRTEQPSEIDNRKHQTQLLVASECRFRWAALLNFLLSISPNRATQRNRTEQHSESRQSEAISRTAE
jgi:hypothetical protein